MEVFHPDLASSEVRTAVVGFQPETVYGNRSAFHEVLLITAAGEKNCAPTKSKFHKAGFIGGVSMLQRGEMLKLQHNTYGPEPRFTKVQELKQAWLFLLKLDIIGLVIFEASRSMATAGMWRRELRIPDCGRPDASLHEAWGRGP